MTQLIHYPLTKIPAIIETNWSLWQPQAGEAEIPSGRQIIPFAYWLKHQQEPSLMERALNGQIGVWFSEEDDVLQNQQWIHAGKKLWFLLAVRFPLFRDGRGFSTAILLRERLDWQGPIWAVGDVLIDQLDQLARVGFDHFVLRDDQDYQMALSQFHLFSARMQDSWRDLRSRASQGGVIGA
ncbi:MAG: DUF934 domain-containing protein [Polynucleobacter sp.]|nr:DUF934 domain-containing protein [Polynucleobacter sp.]MDZ4056322.1 DUF934 domain-containing protein [Polynucleobacter sp.]